MNNWNFVGNLGRDGETRFTKEGTAVTSFSVAVTSGFGKSEATTWANCNLWGKQAESLATYLNKGQKVAISGEVTLRKYTTKDGAEKDSLDVRVNSITLVGAKGEARGQPSQNNAATASQNAPDDDDFSSDIPF